MAGILAPHPLRTGRGTEHAGAVSGRGPGERAVRRSGEKRLEEREVGGMGELEVARRAVDDLDGDAGKVVPDEGDVVGDAEAGVILQMPAEGLGKHGETETLRSLD